MQGAYEVLEDAPEAIVAHNWYDVTVRVHDQEDASIIRWVEMSRTPTHLTSLQVLIVRRGAE